MTLSYMLALLFGILASLLMNIGKGVQKLRARVLLHGLKMFRAEHRKDLSIWLLGTLMLVLVPIPTSLALKFSGSPSLVSALTGIGLVGLVIFSMLVIGERLSTQDAVGIAIVTVGTTVLGYIERIKIDSERPFSIPVLFGYLAIVIAVSGSVCLVALFYRHIHGVAFGFLAGHFVGNAIFLGQVALDKAGGSFWGQLGNAYPYVALCSGTTGFVLIQIGFFRGRALEVVPAVNSSVILTPMYLEAMVYGIYPSTWKLVLVGLLVVGVVLLSTGTAGRVSEQSKVEEAAAVD
jgi:uncharacterized membrane protein